MAQKAHSLSHTKWMCKYHIVFPPKYRRKVIYNQYLSSDWESQILTSHSLFENFKIEILYIQFDQQIANFDFK